MSKEKNPRLRHPDFAANCDFLFGLFPLAFMAIYLYGPRPALMLAVSLLTAVLCALVVARLRGQRYDASENSSLVFAATFTLMLPASAGYYMVVAGVLVGIGLGKHAFGGAGSYPFQPAALAYAAVTVSWPDQIFRYPTPFSSIGLLDTSNASFTESTNHILQAGGVPNIPSLDLLLGNYAGPMGATFCLVIGAVAIYLLLKRRISLSLTVSFLVTCALVSFCTPRSLAVSRLTLMKYEMLSGALIFAAVFLLGESVSAPKNRLARILYGVLTGFLTMMFRIYGSYELGVCFALLLSSAFGGYLDRLCSRITFKRRARGV